MVIQFLSSLMALSSCATACYRTMTSEAFKELGSIIFYMSWMITSAVAFLVFSIGMSLCVIKEAHLAIHPFQLDDGFTFYSLRGVVNFQNRYVRTRDFLGNPPPYTRYPQVPTTAESSQSIQGNNDFTPPPEINETTH
nr:uncharacterized protein LOC124813440 [Hydra vulgaris]